MNGYSNFLEEWSNKTFSEARQQELQQFTREQESDVSLLPSPSPARQSLVLWRELLGTGARVRMYTALDVIWRWDALGDYFMVFKTIFRYELSSNFRPSRQLHRG